MKAKSIVYTVFAYAVMLVGLLALTGWVFDIMVLKRIHPQLVQMSPLSTVMFLLSAIGLLHVKKPGRMGIVLGIIPAAIVCLAACMKLSDLITGYDTGIDTYLFRRSLEGNRMAPNTALNFLLCGLSMLLLRSKSEVNIRAAQLITIGSFFISLLAILGYIYSIRSLYVVSIFFPMALHTAVCFVFLCLGLFFVKPYSGYVGVIMAPRLGGALGRRLLPVAVFLPLALGWISFEVERVHLLNEYLSTSLIVLFMMLIFSIIIWFYARSLNRIDVERREAEKGLRAARDAAEKAKQSQEQFLANMSHEIRTPMNGVIGMTSLLERTNLTSEQEAFVETIRSSGETLLTLINDILDFSKIESGKLELEEQPFSVQAVIEDTFDLLSMAANKKNIDLIYIIQQGVPADIIGDVTRLRQVLVNLISNAIKFTDKGEVLVTVDVLRIDNDRYELEFRVKDTGIGIPEDKVGFLFNAFSQVDVSTTRKYGGTGLGLAISYNLVKLMGGEIGVESVFGEGSTFHFSIRAKADPVIGDTDVADDHLKGKTALIIDDNQTNLYVLGKQCEMKGIEVTPSRSGEEAVKIANETLFDFIITDMMMPGIDGLETAKRLKETKNANTPIILLSSAGSINPKYIGQDRLLAVNLLKPLRMNQFHQVLRNLLSPADMKKANAAAPVKREQENLYAQAPLSILVVEDNAVNQKLLLIMLQKLGYKADLAANGLEAIDSVKRQPYNLVFMDVFMPEMDGLEATRHIRELELQKQPVIVALTANAMAGERERCMAAGMDDFLVKPFKQADLEKSIVEVSNKLRGDVQ